MARVFVNGSILPVYTDETKKDPYCKEVLIVNKYIEWHPLVKGLQLLNYLPMVPMPLRLICSFTEAVIKL